MAGDDMEAYLDSPHFLLGVFEGQCATRKNNPEGPRQRRSRKGIRPLFFACWSGMSPSLCNNTLCHARSDFLCRWTSRSWIFILKIMTAQFFWSLDQSK